MDIFPPPLLFKIPLSKALVARNMGCPISLKLRKISVATRSDSPPGLKVSVGFHFMSVPRSRNDQWLEENFFKISSTRVELSRHTCSFCGFLHTMSLCIDMKMILPWSCSGFHAKVSINLWFSWRFCNVVNLGKIIHSNSIGSLYCLKPLNQSYFSVPSFVWHRELTDFPKTQHRIWEYMNVWLWEIDHPLHRPSGTAFHLQIFPNLFLTLLRFPIFVLESIFESHRTIFLQSVSQCKFSE